MESWHIIILLGITVVVYSSIFLRKPESSAVHFTNEIEETLEQFAVDLEEENKQVIQHVMQLKQQYDTDTRRLSERVDLLDHKLEQMQANPPEKVVQPVNEQPRDHDKFPAVEEKDADLQTVPPSIKERYDEIFMFHEQGKSMDWICKKTGIHKGEVQLIMKLARQEEESRVEK